MSTNKDDDRQGALQKIPASKGTTDGSYSYMDESIEEEKREITEETLPRHSSVSKATFRSVAASASQPQKANANGINSFPEERSNSGDALLSEEQHSDAFSNDSSEVLPGAVHVPGPQMERSRHLELEMETGIPQQGEEGSEEPRESSNNNANEAPFQVEAQVVPETHDIDVIVNQRVNQEVQERLYQEVQERTEEERKHAVTAEVVEPSQEKKICGIPKYSFLGFVAVAILVVAIAVGVSIGVIKSRSSSSSLAITDSTAAPTKGARQAPTGHTPAPTAALKIRFTPVPTATPTGLTPLQSYISRLKIDPIVITSLSSSDITSYLLTGPIPTDIGTFTKLTSLDLS